MSAATDRRRFLGSAVLTAAAAEFFTIGSTDAHSRELDAVVDTAPVHSLAAFGAVKQIPPSIGRQHRSTTRITSPSSSRITAGASAWRMATRSTTAWRSDWPKGRHYRANHHAGW